MYTWMIRFAILLAVFAAPAAMALDSGEMFDDPQKEERAREIGRTLRCLVCQNQSIFDSNAGLAKDLRVLVRERIDAGDSDEEVVDYIAARYGDYVRLKPPVSANTYALWVAPAVILVIGAGLVMGYFRGRKPSPPLTTAERDSARRVLEGKSS